MKKPNYSIQQITDKYPVALKTAAEVAETLRGITEERLVDLSETGYLPHYRIDDGPPLFQLGEVKKWLAQNLIQRCEGQLLPERIQVVASAPSPTNMPPASIAGISRLQQLPSVDYQPSVYFLCEDDEVVYVGQSVSPAARVATHRNDPGKSFDRVYLLPVPRDELDNVEAALIHHLQPRNQGKRGTGNRINAPTATRPGEEVLKDLGIEVAEQEEY